MGRDAAHRDSIAGPTSPLSFAPGGGETGLHLIDRVGKFYADLCRDQQDCVVVSHGGPLKILTALLQNTPVDLLAAAPPIEFDQDRHLSGQ